MAYRRAEGFEAGDVWARSQRVLREEARRYGFNPPPQARVEPRRAEHRGWVNAEHPGYYLNIGGELRAYRGHDLGDRTPRDATSAAAVWAAMERASPLEASVIRKTRFPFESAREWVFNAADGWPMKAYLSFHGRTFFGPDVERILANQASTSTGAGSAPPPPSSSPGGPPGQQWRDQLASRLGLAKGYTEDELGRTYKRRVKVLYDDPSQAAQDELREIADLRTKDRQAR
jgi:hypothetical protein